MKFINPYVFAVATLLLVSCSSKKETLSLKDAYKNDFYIGTALSADQIQEKIQKKIH